MGGLIGIFAVGYIWDFFLRFFHGLGVVGLDLRSLRLQSANDGERGREANVVGIRLERQTPHCDFLPPHHPHFVSNLLDETFDPALVNLLHFFEQGKITARFLGDSDEGLHILRKAEASKTDSRIQECGTDARIQAHPIGNLGYICSDHLAQVCHHIDERDLHRQEGIRGMLNQLGRIRIRSQEDGVLALGAIRMDGASELLLDNRTVDLAQKRFCTGRVSSDDDPVGV